MFILRCLIRHARGDVREGGLGLTNLDEREKPQRHPGARAWKASRPDEITEGAWREETKG